MLDPLYIVAADGNGMTTAELRTLSQPISIPNTAIVTSLARGRLSLEGSSGRLDERRRRGICCCRNGLYRRTRSSICLQTLIP